MTEWSLYGGKGNPDCMPGKEIKIMKTGDVIHMGESQIAVLKTHNDEKKDIRFLIDAAAARGRLSEERFWNTVFDLYPEIKGFDIYINWKKKEITIRGKREVI